MHLFFLYILLIIQIYEIRLSSQPTTIRFLPVTHCSNAKKQPFNTIFFCNQVMYCPIKTKYILNNHLHWVSIYFIYIICMAIQDADLHCNYIMQINIKHKKLFKISHGRFGLNT